MIIKTFASINGEGPQELDSDKTLMICFFSKSQTNTLQKLKANFPRSTIVGCSSAGEILDKSVLDNSVVVSAMKFESTNFKVINTPLADNGMSLNLGKSIYQQLKSHDLQSIFVLSNGLKVNGTQLSEGLRFDNNIPILGGLAGDGKDFKETLVFNNGDFIDGIVSVGLYGERLKINSSSFGGWVSFGPKRKVTKSKNNVLYELDDKPALSLYKEYLGKEATNLPSSGLLFPLSITNKNSKDIIRTILAVSEADQSITFAGDVPEGSEVRLMHADYQNLINAAQKAAASIGNKNQGHEYLAVAISCVGRRLVLGEYTDLEIKALHSGLVNLTNLVGFYSYGEICPTAFNNCELHNQTMTLFTIAEDNCA